MASAPRRKLSELERIEVAAALLEDRIHFLMPDRYGPKDQGDAGPDESPGEYDLLLEAVRDALQPAGACGGGIGHEWACVGVLASGLKLCLRELGTSYRRRLSLPEESPAIAVYKEPSAEIVARIGKAPLAEMLRWGIEHYAPKRRPVAVPEDPPSASPAETSDGGQDDIKE